MTTPDLRQQWKHPVAPRWTAAMKVERVDVPEIKFITIDGRIEPGDAPGTSPRFGEMAAAIIAQADAQGCYTVGSLCRTRRGGAGH